MVMNTIINRKSVRKYSEKQVSEEIIDRIIEAGRLAPSWVNVQPWKFIIVKSQQTKDLLFESSGGQKHVKNAPVVICCVADLDDWNHTNFGKVLTKKGIDEQTKEFMLTSKIFNPSNLGEYETLLRSVEQLTYAVSYMTLAAAELGLGCCVVGAMANELTKKDDSITGRVKEALGLNNRQVLVDMLTLGYEEAPTAAKKIRKEYRDQKR